MNQISDELYEQLEDQVIDAFPEIKQLLVDKFSEFLRDKEHITDDDLVDVVRKILESGWLIKQCLDNL